MTASLCCTLLHCQFAAASMLQDATPQFLVMHYPKIHANSPLHPNSSAFIAQPALPLSTPPIMLCLPLCLPARPPLLLCLWPRCHPSSRRRL